MYLQVRKRFQKLFTNYFKIFLSRALLQKQRQSIKTKAYSVTAFVGRHNLTVVNETGAVEHSLWRVIIHDDWNSEHPRFDADIALAVLENDVAFNNHVEPVCLPTSTDETISGLANVVGWGRSEKSDELGLDYDPTPNELEVPLVDREKCVTEVSKLRNPASFRAFCAGFVNESKSACNGDSGGGLYSLNDFSGNFEVKGIVSSSLVDEEGRCNIQVYTLFTDVRKFVDWIEEKKAEGKGEKEEKKIPFETNQRFSCCSPFEKRCEILNCLNPRPLSFLKIKMY